MSSEFKNLVKYAMITNFLQTKASVALEESDKEVKNKKVAVSLLQNL